MSVPPYSSLTVMPCTPRSPSFFHRSAGNSFVAVDLGRTRRDLGSAEGLQRVAQGVDGLAEVEVQAGHVHGVSPCRSCPGASGSLRESIMDGTRPRMDAE
jgi:hypothetical protein